MCPAPKSGELEGGARKPPNSARIGRLGVVRGAPTLLPIRRAAFNSVTVLARGRLCVDRDCH